MNLRDFMNSIGGMLDELGRYQALVRSARETPLNEDGLTIFKHFQMKSREGDKNAGEFFIGLLSLDEKIEELAPIALYHHIKLLQETAETISQLYDCYGKPRDVSWPLVLNGKDLPTLPLIHPFIDILRKYSGFDDSE